MISNPHSTNIQGLNRPARSTAIAGKAKIPAPIVPFSAIAPKPSWEISRRNPPCCCPGAATRGTQANPAMRWMVQNAAMDPIE